MDNSSLGPTRVDNGPLQGPRSCQQLDKDVERTAAIEKCGPTQIDNLQQSERYAGVLLQARYQLAEARLENNPYPLPDVRSQLQTHSLKSKFLGKAALLKHTEN